MTLSEALEAAYHRADAARKSSICLPPLDAAAFRRLMAAGRPRAASTLLGSSGTSTRAIIAEAGLSKKKHLKSKLQFDRLSWLGMSGL
jgi:hypothetical protein